MKPGIPLTESRNNLRDVWQDVYQAQDTNIHLILVDCGVGKTHVLLEQPLEKMFVAAPTHQLKGEHLKRYPYNGHLVWPEIPELPNPFSEAMQQRHASGIGRTSHIIQECINNGHHIDANIQAACLNYLQAEEAIETAPLVFCTHEKALTAVNDVIDTIVFDEDPLSTIMRSTTIRADDMEPMIDFLEHQGDADLHEMAGYARWVMTLEKGIFRRRRYFFCGDILRVIAHNDFPRLSSPAYALFLCQVVEKQQDGNLVCTQVRPLPSEKKVIILSASANVPFYQALNKDRVIVYDLRGTELKGQIIQHPEHSYSKASLQGISEDELARRIQADTERYGLEGVIVYKQLKEIHDAGAFLRGSQVPVICNYGAQYGLDAFKGRTIGIYGVPHLTDGAYKTMALAIGLPINDYMRYQPIHHNGFEFEMWTYKNEKLRALQLAAIDAEYIQAIGRARLVDHDATVHVFSNYPVPGAVITKDD